MDTIVSRLKEYLDFKCVSTSNAEIEIGSSNGTLSKPFNSGTTIKTNTLEKFLKKYTDINSEWLLTGTGNMLKESKEDSNVIGQKDIAINYNRMPAVITVSEEDTGKENIEIVPAKLAAGYVGGGYADPAFVKELPKFRLPFLNNGTFRCFGIEGYSMENGIRDNAFFVGRFLDNIRDFGEGKIHALIIPELDTFLLKRVFRHPINPNMLILRSDNNDIANTYPDIHIHLRFIAEMWSYASTISFKEPYYNMEKFRQILATQPQKVIYE